MKIFISVVSHSHCKLINELNCLSCIKNSISIVIKSNKSGDDFCNLTSKSNVHWIDESYGLGFGNNNNYIYSYCVEQLGMKDEDLFVILNPDVFITNDALVEIEKLFIHKKVSKIAAINLYKDYEFTCYDNSIRKFPTFINFAKSLMGMQNSSIMDKSTVDEIQEVDWAAGSFLAVTAGHYQRLGGFDENYFMYCEDIDLCYRSYKLGYPVNYIPSIKAVHLGMHANRKIFSKHFYWHVSSVMRFLLTKMNMTSPKTSIK